MHWTFFLFAFCAVAGWSMGAVARVVFAGPPAWLVD